MFTTLNQTILIPFDTKFPELNLSVFKIPIILLERVFGNKRGCKKLTLTELAYLDWLIWKLENRIPLVHRCVLPKFKETVT